MDNDKTNRYAFTENYHEEKRAYCPTLLEFKFAMNTSLAKWIRASQIDDNKNQRAYSPDIFSEKETAPKKLLKS